jgi:hypothetical protein
MSNPPLANQILHHSAACDHWNNTPKRGVKKEGVVKVHDQKDE